MILCLTCAKPWAGVEFPGHDEGNLGCFLMLPKCDRCRADCAKERRCIPNHAVWRWIDSLDLMLATTAKRAPTPLEEDPVRAAAAAVPLTSAGWPCRGRLFSGPDLVRVREPVLPSGPKQTCVEPRGVAPWGCGAPFFLSLTRSRC